MVADSLYEGPREGVRRQVFVPHVGNSGSAVYARAGLGSSSAYTALRRAVKELDSGNADLRAEDGRAAAR